MMPSTHRTTRPDRGSATLVAALAIALLLAPAPAAAETGPRADAQTQSESDKPPEPLSREQAIAQTLAAIEQEIEDHGGSWQAWAEKLEPYRADIRGFLENPGAFGWPWPAKENYVFQGAAVRLHMLDDLDDLGVYESIVHFNQQLRSLGIDLIVAIIPSKMSVYPDYPYAAIEDEPRRGTRVPESRSVSIQIKHLMHRLLEADVEVLDLHGAFADFRREHGQDKPLYYVRDSHYMNRAAQFTAELLAQRLKRYDFVQEALEDNPWEAVPDARHDGAKADPHLMRVRHRDGHWYRDVPASPVLTLGDSHMAYNQHLQAHISAQIALRTGLPVSRTWSEGMSRDIPQHVARDRFLDQRRVVIIHYSERMIETRPDRRAAWPIVNLPGAEAAPQAAGPAGAPRVQNLPVRGTVAQVSNPPDEDAPYPHYLMKLYVEDLSFAGAPLGPGDGVVHVLAMHNRKVLPVASIEEGEQVSLRLTTWSQVEDRYGALNTASLPDVELELQKPLYWGVLPDQPELTDE